MKTLFAKTTRVVTALIEPYLRRKVQIMLHDYAVMSNIFGEKKRLSPDDIMRLYMMHSARVIKAITGFVPPESLMYVSEEQEEAALCLMKSLTVEVMSEWPWPLRDRMAFLLFNYLSMQTAREYAEMVGGHLE